MPGGVGICEEPPEELPPPQPMPERINRKDTVIASAGSKTRGEKFCQRELAKETNRSRRARARRRLNNPLGGVLIGEIRK